MNPVKKWDGIKAYFLAASSEWVINTADIIFTTSWSHWSKDRKHTGSDWLDLWLALPEVTEPKTENILVHSQRRLPRIVFRIKEFLQYITVNILHIFQQYNFLKDYKCFQTYTTSRICSMKEGWVVQCVQISEQSKISE